HITSFCGKAAKHHGSQSELHHLPAGQTSLFPDVWHTNVLLAPICDKNRLKPGMILASAGFL
ncbi:MAG: hypothetical protein II192_02945, partial [Clostridia bacterium]|nr:hypothetical protein [Clostridia bacterium]